MVNITVGYGSGSPATTAGEFYLAVFGGTPLVQVFDYAIEHVVIGDGDGCTTDPSNANADALSCSPLTP